MRKIQIVDSIGGGPAIILEANENITWGEFLEVNSKFSRLKAVMGKEWSNGKAWVLEKSDILPNDDNICIFLVEEGHKGAFQGGVNIAHPPEIEPNEIKEILQEIHKVKNESVNFEVLDKESLENYRLEFLSRNGLLNQLFEDFKQIPNDQKREMGKHLNELKTFVQGKFDEHQEKFENQTTVSDDSTDYSLPTTDLLGSRHPLNIVQNSILEVFKKLGFGIGYGPEIETDWYNFSALNFPENHPARDMQDTFFVDKDHALRTHTTSVQIRVLENEKPPVRMVSPGRVYRNEAISARAHCFFHQVDGFYVDKGVSFADLKHTLYLFVNELFGSDTKVRFRPSYFPFTEVSAEMDCTCYLCKGKGCNICKYTGWVEILGSGMIDPAVLKNCNIDPEVYSGFAFGMGVERITMLKYNVKDLRMYSENNVKFLGQFKGVSV